MSDEQQEKRENLCENPDQLRDAIALFNDIFKFKSDPTLSYFFDKDAILDLMKDPKCQGIKVFPALEDDLQKREISITMVLKPHIKGKPLVEKIEDLDFLAASAICCPTPGFPFEKGRKKRIKHWIQKLVDLL